MKIAILSLLSAAIIITVGNIGVRTYRGIYDAGYTRGYHTAVEETPVFDYATLVAQLNEEAKHLNCVSMYLSGDRDTELQQFPEGGTLLFRPDHLPRGRSEYIKLCEVNHELI